MTPSQEPNLPKYCKLGVLDSEGTWSNANLQRNCTGDYRFRFVSESKQSKLLTFFTTKHFQFFNGNCESYLSLLSASALTLVEINHTTVKQASSLLIQKYIYGEHQPSWLQNHIRSKQLVPSRQPTLFNPKSFPISPSQDRSSSFHLLYGSAFFLLTSVTYVLLYFLLVSSLPCHPDCYVLLSFPHSSQLL